MDLSVIIVSYNTKKLTVSCIKSVINNTEGIDYEIILVDNDSKDGSVLLLEKLDAKKSITLIKNKKNIGFAKANNQGTKIAKGKYVLFLNSDTKVNDNVLGEVVDWMETHKKVGAMSCKLKNKDGSTQATGGYFPTLIRVFSWMTIQDIPGVDKIIKPFHPMKEKSFTKDKGFFENRHQQDWIKGAFMLIPKEVLDRVSGFDTDYFMYAEDVDLCYKIKKMGLEVYYEPKWSITHLGGASGKAGDHLLKEFDGIKTFYKKHHPNWQYPILRLLLKVGSLGRIVVFGLKDGRVSAKIYAKAFRVA